MKLSYLVALLCLGLAVIIWQRSPALQSRPIHGSILDGQVIQLGDPDDTPDEHGQYHIAVYTNCPDIAPAHRGPLPVTISADRHRRIGLGERVTFWIIGPDSTEAELTD